MDMNNIPTTSKTDLSDLIIEVEQTRHALIRDVNENFNRILAYLGNYENASTIQADYIARDNEHVLSLSADPILFNSKKPVAVSFRNERVFVKTWRGVLLAILQQCCKDPAYLEKIMKLRGKKAKPGQRIMLSNAPYNLEKPVEVMESLYVETHYGASNMMKALISKVLQAIGYDYSDIKIVLRA